MQYVCSPSKFALVLNFPSMLYESYRAGKYPHQQQFYHNSIIAPYESVRICSGLVVPSGSVNGPTKSGIMTSLYIETARVPLVYTSNGQKELLHYHH